MAVHHIPGTMISGKARKQEAAVVRSPVTKIIEWREPDGERSR